ncbi:MAG: cytochrome c3 family protein [Raoultibacter sp.]
MASHDVGVRGFLDRACVLLAVVAAVACLSLALTSCVPKEIPDGTLDDAAVAWSPDADCSTCHVVEQESYESANCTVSVHSSVLCMSCHQDDGKLAKAHEEATAESKMPKSLKKTEVTKDACLSCHDQQDILQATANSTALIDENGIVVNPHDLPQVGDHGAIACSDCHEMHTKEPKEQLAQDTCTDCHHKNVYECGTCHS